MIDWGWTGEGFLIDRFTSGIPNIPNQVSSTGDFVTRTQLFLLTWVRF